MGIETRRAPRAEQTRERSRKSVGLLASGELQVRAVLVVGQLREGDLAPEVGGEEGIGFCDLERESNEKMKYRGCKRELTASKIAFKKLPIVAAEPLDCV